MAQKDREFTIDLSAYPLEQREAIALEIIDQIQKRTKKGLDKDGKPFAPYSKEYKESLGFKIAGKGSKVNLVLSGDMLDAIEIVQNFQNGKVKIGYSSGNSEGGKAEGNILGTYGQPKRVGPERDFLGISSAELSKILAKYPEGSTKAEENARKKLALEKASEKISGSKSSRLSGKVDLEDLED